MRVALRPSGGRGEYELAGRQGQTHASELFDKLLFYEITPDVTVPGRAMATRVQGKPRFRLEDKRSTTHLARLLAGVLLLPKPKRELRHTHGKSLVQREAYSITSIKVDISRAGKSEATLRPTDLLLENASGERLRVGMTSRMFRIARLWTEAPKHTSAVAALVCEHSRAVTGGEVNHKVIEGLAASISEALGTKGDPIGLLEKELGIAAECGDGGVGDLDGSFGEVDATPPVEARLARVKQWRDVAMSGSTGQKFRSGVCRAYDFRCLFSGERLPKTAASESPGVEAAHLLPWAATDINAVSNGICLSRHCMWAFNAGVLKLSWDKGSGGFRLEIPEAVRAAASLVDFDLASFEKLCGVIPESRLPANKADWPDVRKLGDLNKFLFAAGK